jgi:hypothetical protein
MIVKISLFETIQSVIYHVHREMKAADNWLVYYTFENSIKKIKKIIISY